MSNFSMLIFQYYSSYLWQHFADGHFNQLNNTVGRFGVVHFKSFRDQSIKSKFYMWHTNKWFQIAFSCPFNITINYDL